MNADDGLADQVIVAKWERDDAVLRTDAALDAYRAQCAANIATWAILLEERARIARVWALHTQVIEDGVILHEESCDLCDEEGHTIQACSHCRSSDSEGMSGVYAWPCPTIRALNPTEEGQS